MMMILPGSVLSIEVKRNFLKDRDDLLSVTERKNINDFDRDKFREAYRQALKEYQENHPDDGR
jgi:hypothetical protein